MQFVVCLVRIIEKFEPIRNGFGRASDQSTRRTNRTYCCLCQHVARIGWSVLASQTPLATKACHEPLSTVRFRVLGDPEIEKHIIHYIFVNKGSDIGPA